LIRFWRTVAAETAAAALAAPASGLPLPPLESLRAEATTESVTAWSEPLMPASFTACDQTHGPQKAWATQQSTPAVGVEKQPKSDERHVRRLAPGLTPNPLLVLTV